MTTLIATFTIIVITGAMIYAGYRDGAFAAIYSLVRNLIAFLVAMTFFERLGALITRFAGSTYPGPDYYRMIAFGVLFGAVVSLGRWLRIKYTVPEVRCYSPLDLAVGPLAGLCNGIVVTGVILLLWSQAPFVKYIPYDYGRVNVDRLVVDSGGLLLRFYDFSTRRMRGGRAFLLNGEPLEEDRNNNGVFDAGEDSYRDLNNNGRWDAGWLWRYKTHADIRMAQLEAMLGAGGEPEEVEQ